MFITNFQGVPAGTPSVLVSNILLLHFTSWRIGEQVGELQGGLEVGRVDHERALS